MTKAVEVRRPQRGVAVYRAPLVLVVPAMHFATKALRRRDVTVVFHEPYRVREAVDIRDKLLPLFAEAEAAAQILRDAWHEPLDRKTASAMVGAMLASFGTKPDPDVLVAMLDMLEGGEAIAGMIGAIKRDERLGLVSPAVLAMACRVLVATQTFSPKTAELRAACHKAEAALLRAEHAADTLLGLAQRADAVLLEFDHAEWERPYLTPQYRPLLGRMLGLHAIYGDRSREWESYTNDDDGKPLHPFDRLVNAEWDKLDAPAPEAPPEPSTTNTDHDHRRR